MIAYCPACWSEIPEHVQICPHCGIDVDRLALEQDYVQKLIAALDHPEPTTPVRAAWILGIRKDTRAVQRLARLARESEDPYIVEAAVEALGRIGDATCLETIRFAAHHGAVRVREKAQLVLVLIQRAPRAQRDSLDAPGADHYD